MKLSKEFYEELKNQGLLDESAEIIEVVKEYNSLEDYHASKELKNLYIGYEDSLESKINYDNKNTNLFDFIKAFISSDGKIYKEYIIKEIGLKILSEEKLGSCVSDSSFDRVNILDGLIIITKTNWSRSIENIKAFVKNDIIVYSI